jgi:hypothetical protein
VSEQEAARLGKDLTPLGGEVAGNEDGTIPAWTGKWKGLPPGLKYDGPGSKRADPCADEKPLFSISPMPIRRSKKARWNATHAELSNGVESVQHYTGGVAFPFPLGPEEGMWNTRANSCVTSVHVVHDGYGVFSNGERAHDAVDFRQSFPFNNPDFVRYELRRVWLVEVNLAPGKRPA